MPGRARDRNEARGFGMGLHKHSQSQPHLLDQCFSKKPPLTSCRHADDTWPLWGPNPDTGSPGLGGPGRGSALWVWICILKFEKHHGDLWVYFPPHLFPPCLCSVSTQPLFHKACAIASGRPDYFDSYMDRTPTDISALRFS